jgi:hypothetical protein
MHKPRQHAVIGMTGRWLAIVAGEWRSGGVVNDALDFAAVDAEFAGYGALAAASMVPGPYRLLHRWRASWRAW